MTPAPSAYDRLMEAIEARGAARHRARQEVDRQFAAVISKLYRECEIDNAEKVKRQLAQQQEQA